jgi:hypothetical protein
MTYSFLRKFLSVGHRPGKQFDFSVTDTAVKATPVWTPEATCPPLEPRRAIEIATTQLHDLVKDPAKWYFLQINLVDFGDHLHWVYVVMFDRQYPPDLAVYGGDYFQIPVLMNGATLKPKVRDVGPDKIEPSR